MGRRRGPETRVLGARFTLRELAYVDHLARRADLDSRSAWLQLLVRGTIIKYLEDYANARTETRD